MKLHSLRLVLTCAAAFFTHITLAQNPATPEADHVPGELLVKFVPQAPAAAILDASHGVGARELEQFDNIGVRHWRLGQGVSVDQALKILAAPGLQRWIEYAEPNYLYHAVDLPNDPDFARLWGLYNGGQTGGTKGADVHAVEAWMAGFTGNQNVVVAVLDTGIDYNHPDLAANIWTNPGEIPGNGIDDDRNGYVDDVRGWDFVNNDNDPMDDYGHGTHVSGTIGGSGNNGIGVVGVNWRVKLMPLKWLDASGSGTSANAIKAINYAAAKKVRITSNSWGGFPKSKSMQDAIKNSGGLFVVAAGNSGSSTVAYPAGYSLDLSNVLTVAATDHNDQLAAFSNFGAWVHLAAPGVETWSTYPNGGYATASGTSMATPHVSGAAALVLAHNPGLSILDVKNRLLQTVDVLPSLSGKVTTSGRLNVQKALGAPTPAVPVVYLVKAELTADSNHNGWAEPGETIQITVTLGNLRFATATAVSASLSANTIPLGTQTVGDIGPDGSVAVVFTCAIDSGASNGQTLHFTLDTRVNGTPHRSLPFDLTLGTRELLLVNGAGAYESFYTQALDAAGYSYRTMRTSDELPTADEMSRYKAVVWFGDYFSPAEQQELANYLDGQGHYANPPRLFVTGQDLGYNLAEFGSESDRFFYQTYLHARYIRDDTDIYSLVGVNDPLTGLTLSIPLNAGDGARNQFFQDEIAAIDPAAPLLNYSGDGQAALKYDASALRLVYFAFGFEAIDSTNPNTAPRAEVLRRVLGWLLENPADGNFAPVAVPRTQPTVVAVAPAASVDVTLDGSRSYDFGGTIVGYEWSEGSTRLGTDPIITLPLSFGLHAITLTVTDNTGKSGAAIAQVSVQQRWFADNMETAGAQPWLTQGNVSDRASKSSSPTPGTSNLWHKSTRRGSDPGHSPVTSWYYGIDAQGNYDTGLRNWGRLISPAITLPPSQNSSRAELKVSQLVNVEGGNYEYAIIQISTDDGNSWTDLLRHGNRLTSFVDDTLDLSSYMGRPVRIGFMIDTKDRVSNGFEGWYVDDVVLTVIP